MQLKPFRIERYYAQHEFSTRYMLSSSDCESRTVAELLTFEPDAERRLHETWCGYTESPGSAELREAIAALYERAGADDVIVCSCAEEGIFLVNHALLAAGDHVIVETPCYESALELARSTGAQRVATHLRQWVGARSRRPASGALTGDTDALRQPAPQPDGHTDAAHDV
jgi:DNA-binding transcriptional MocR family regulator